MVGSPPTATAHRERRARRLGEDPRQRGGACRVARQGTLRGPDAVGSGAPVGWPGAHAEVERERTRELARIGSNLNRIAPLCRRVRLGIQVIMREGCGPARARIVLLDVLDRAGPHRTAGVTGCSCRFRQAPAKALPSARTWVSMPVQSTIVLWASLKGTVIWPRSRWRLVSK